MKLTLLIPTLFYADINIALRLFVDGLAFKVVYAEPGTDGAMHIVERDSIRLILMQNAELAAMDRPQIRIETDDIDTLFQQVQQHCPQYLHPNLKTVKTQPWGLREFAMLDESTVCIVFQETVPRSLSS